MGRQFSLAISSGKLLAYTVPSELVLLAVRETTSLSFVELKTKLLAQSYVKLDCRSRLSYQAYGLSFEVASLQREPHVVACLLALSFIPSDFYS